MDSTLQSVGLFWDIENGTCQIPRRLTLEECAEILRSIAQQRGVDLKNRLIRAVCGGSRCNRKRCYFGDLCSDLDRRQWEYNRPFPTQIEGVELYCGWSVFYDQADRADDIIFKQLKDVFSQGSGRKSVMVVTGDKKLRKHAMEDTVKNHFTQAVLCHPENLHDPVWPREMPRNSQPYREPAHGAHVTETTGELDWKASLAAGAVALGAAALLGWLAPKNNRR